MQRELGREEWLIKNFAGAYKNGMSDFIFCSLTSFLALPPLCSKEKVTQKQHLRLMYTHVLIEAIFFIGRRKKDKETTKIKRYLVSENCFVFQKLGTIRLLSLTWRVF